MNILVTGVSGFLGSHCAYELLSLGHKVIGIDNFSNSNGKQLPVLHSKGDFSFHELDLSNSDDTSKLFKDLDKISCVFHFAGLKAVGESVEIPYNYWSNNLESTFNLVREMLNYDCRSMIFSSSATVYGDSQEQPLIESMPSESLSPYGSTKIAIESFLNDMCQSESLDVVSLRYFNPVGSIKNGDLYEDPFNKPNNIMPRIIRVALGIDETISVFGNDYNTKDGTAERDYIHVMDLIEGHIKAMHFLSANKGFHTFNLGTGDKVSVLKLIDTFESLNNVNIPYKMAPRRDGDVEICYCDPSKALNSMDWECEYTLDDMCLDSWNAVKNLDIKK